MIGALHAIWTAILTPSRPDEAAYDTLVINLGHAVVGAALVTLVPVWLAATAPALRLAVTGGYWIVKENGDLRRGGSLRDGAWDTAAVALGAFYGAGWWPAAVIALALAAALTRKGA